MWTSIWFPHIHTYRTTEPKTSREMGARIPQIPGFRAVLSSTYPTPPHLLPHPTSRDLADPVKLRLALHGHPLQGGQIQHRAASNVIVIMTAPVKIVVGKLESKIKKEREMYNR